MDERTQDYAVGYGRPPVESRFHKGKSGNPGGRPRRTKPLVALLGEALSQPSGFAKPDGTWMTRAEAIFAGLAEAATGADLRVKRLLLCTLSLRGAQRRSNLDRQRPHRARLLRSARNDSFGFRIVAATMLIHRIPMLSLRGAQ